MGLDGLPVGEAVGLGGLGCEGAEEGQEFGVQRVGGSGFGGEEGCG